MPRFFLCSIVFLFSLAGFSQDTSWAAKDTMAFAEANVMATYAGAADFLGNYLSADRPVASHTPYFVELHHKVALWYFEAATMGKALNMVDRTLALRQTIPGVQLTELARTEHLKGTILKELSSYRPAAKWYDQSLLTLERAMAEGDSLGTNLYRIQYFTTWSALMAVFLYDFDKADLLLQQMPRLVAQAAGKISQNRSLAGQFEYHNVSGLFWQKQGDYSQAEVAYRQALEPQFANVPLLVSSIPLIRGNLGYSFFQGARYAEAGTEINRSITELVALAQSNPRFFRFLSSNYAFLLMTQWKTEQYDQIDSTLVRGLRSAKKAYSSGKGRDFATLYTYAARAAADQRSFVRADSLLSLRSGRNDGDP